MKILLVLFLACNTTLLATKRNSCEILQELVAGTIEKRAQRETSNARKERLLVDLQKMTVDILHEYRLLIADRTETDARDLTWNDHRAVMQNAMDRVLARQHDRAGWLAYGVYGLTFLTSVGISYSITNSLETGTITTLSIFGLVERSTQILTATLGQPAVDRIANTLRAYILRPILSRVNGYHLDADTETALGAIHMRHVHGTTPSAHGGRQLTRDFVTLTSPRLILCTTHCHANLEKGLNASAAIMGEVLYQLLAEYRFLLSDRNIVNPIRAAFTDVFITGKNFPVFRQHFRNYLAQKRPEIQPNSDVYSRMFRIFDIWFRPDEINALPEVPGESP